MILLRLSLAAALAAVTAGCSCYSPGFDHCNVQCGTGAEPCPSGTSCRGGFCLTADEPLCPGGDGDGAVVDGAAIDAADPDAMPPLPGLVQLSLGWEHACAIDDAGALWCWGRNDLGQLGVDDTDNRGAAIRIGEHSDWTWISAGTGHTCGLRGTPDAGSLWCWGWNADGQVGNGLNGQTRQLTPVEIEPDTTWRRVAAGTMFTCGIQSDGSLWCWGYNNDGQLANGTPGTPSRAYAPVEVTGSTAWQEITLGAFHACGLQSGGAVYCWGGGFDGRLGYGDEDGVADTDTPVAMPTASTWIQIDAGENHTCALSADFDVWCWGNNGAGQADGMGGLSPLVPTLMVGISGDWEQVSSGTLHTCARRSGEIACWGFNESGQTGGVPGGSLMADTTVFAGLLAVAAGGDSTCVLLDDGTVRCFGGNGAGQIGNGEIANKLVPVRVGADGEPWASVEIGVNHSCAINQASELWCWGRNLEGQLGLGHASPITVPTRVTAPDLDWVQVAAGSGHTCAVANGDDLYCWGSESEGETGTAGDSNLPLRIESGRDWQQVTTGTSTTCALTTGGERACMGRNAEGQKGNGDLLPMGAIEYFGATDADDWLMLSEGVFGGSAITLTAPTELYSWGDDSYGQLGDGTPTMASTTEPTLSASAGTGWTEVHQALFHACGLRAGALMCWGYSNPVGADNAGVIVPLPADVGVTDDWVSVDTGSDVSCAVRADGELFCWGLNEFGQLGNGQSALQQLDIVPLASPIGGGEFVRVGVGSQRGCAIKSDTAASAPPGSLWCWGENLHGAVGDGTSGIFTPTTVVQEQ
jgi:alpha-tubulin suppressor-like RCC1 family protein